MKHTDEELREMLLMTNIELSRLTEKMLSMKASAALITSSTYNIDKRR